MREQHELSLGIAIAEGLGVVGSVARAEAVRGVIVDTRRDRTMRLRSPMETRSLRSTRTPRRASSAIHSSTPE